MEYVKKNCPCGEIKGIGTDSYLLFKGVRYAYAERWKSPQEVTEWSGTYDATAPGHWCYQRDSFIAERTAVGCFYRDEIVEKQAVVYSEDCLNLNIWTPVHAEKAPVLVFVHGGSYETGGGGGLGFNNGKDYCKQGIILITINYRLNVFASAVGEGYSGNYGMQDQICALRWIQRNISAFGGDPDRVTIMGESAGAMSVQNLIFAPSAKGLFHRAIMLSGAGILPKAFKIKDSAIAREIWSEVQKKLGVPNMETLRGCSPADLYLAWNEVRSSDPRYAFAATPIIENNTIPDEPKKLVESGAVNAVPSIVGLLSEDMWPLDLYHAAVEWAVQMNRAGYPPVYGLYFDRAAPGSNHGAFHGADLRYAFHTFDRSWRPYNEIDERISSDMITYFSNFIKTGVPYGTDLQTWAPISQDNHQFMRFGDEACAMFRVPEEHLMDVQKRNKPFPGM